MKKTIVLTAVISILFAGSAHALSWTCHVDTSSGLKSVSIDKPSGDEARSEARRKVAEWYPNATIYSVRCK